MRRAIARVQVLSLSAICAVLVLLGLVSRPVRASNLKTSLEAHFSDLKTSFDQASSSPAIRSTKLSYVDRYFVGVLRRNQTFYTLIRTNSKGMVINEVVRAQKPARDFRDVSKQEWYTQIARHREEYQGFLREDNGRYYLFWSSPYFMGARSDRFGGAIVVKVDLWDCFHRFSADIDEPFLARLGNRSLYSHKWKEEIAYREERLAVPGVERISIRYPQTEAASTQPPQSDTAPATFSPAAAAAVPVSSPPSSAAPPVPSSPVKQILSLKGERLVIALVVCGAFLLTVLFLLFQLISRLRNYLLMRRIEREDRF